MKYNIIDPQMFNSRSIKQSFQFENKMIYSSTFLCTIVIPKSIIIAYSYITWKKCYMRKKPALVFIVLLCMFSKRKSFWLNISFCLILQYEYYRVYIYIYIRILSNYTPLGRGDKLSLLRIYIPLISLLVNDWIYITLVP